MGNSSRKFQPLRCVFTSHWSLKGRIVLYFMSFLKLTLHSFLFYVLHLFCIVECGDKLHHKRVITVCESSLGLNYILTTSRIAYAIVKSYRGMIYL